MPTNPAPVACAFHDELELRALRRQTCRLVVLDEAGRAIRIETVITDLQARQGREYAVVGDGRLIPLDRIVSLDGIRR